MVTTSPPSILLAFLYLVLAISYPLALFLVVLPAANRLSSEFTILSIIQAIIAFLILIGYSAILFFFSWRLDPLMLFAQFALALLIAFLLVKDILQILLQIRE